MTDEQLNYYYNKDVDKKQCWVSKDYNCPLKEQCNGLFKPECKEHIDNEEACHAIDKMIEWYYQVEEPEFLKFYNCHLERHGRNQLFLPLLAGIFNGRKLLSRLGMFQLSIRVYLIQKLLTLKRAN